jgi:hypothetical protein
VHLKCTVRTEPRRLHATEPSASSNLACPAAAPAVAETTQPLNEPAADGGLPAASGAGSCGVCLGPQSRAASVTVDVAASTSTVQANAGAVADHCSLVFSLPLCAAPNALMQNPGSTPSQPASQSASAAPSSQSLTSPNLSQSAEFDMTSPEVPAFEAFLPPAAAAGTETPSVAELPSQSAAAGAST